MAWIRRADKSGAVACCGRLSIDFTRLARAAFRMRPHLASNEAPPVVDWCRTNRKKAGSVEPMWLRCDRASRAGRRAGDASVWVANRVAGGGGGGEGASSGDRCGGGRGRWRSFSGSPRARSGLGPGLGGCGQAATGRMGSRAGSGWRWCAPGGPGPVLELATRDRGARERHRGAVSSRAPAANPSRPCGRAMGMACDTRSSSPPTP